VILIIIFSIEHDFEKLLVNVNKNWSYRKSKWKFKYIFCFIITFKVLFFLKFRHSFILKKCIERLKEEDVFKLLLNKLPIQGLRGQRFILKRRAKRTLVPLGYVHVWKLIWGQWRWWIWVD